VISVLKVDVDDAKHYSIYTLFTVIYLLTYLGILADGRTEVMPIARYASMITMNKPIDQQEIGDVKRGRGRVRGQFLEVEAKAEAKNNYEKVSNNVYVYSPRR